MRLFIFLFLIFFVGFVCASELTISPPQLSFEGKVNEKICQRLNISVEGNLIGEDRWAERGFIERKFLAHKLNAEDLDIVLNYPEKMSVSGERIIDVCLTGVEKGIYHGLLLYRKESNPSGVGVWLEVNLTKNENSLIKLTGAVVNDALAKSNILITFSLVIALIILLIILKLVQSMNRIV